MIEIDETAFRRLTESLNPGSFTVESTAGAVIIRSIYADYVWRR